MRIDINCDVGEGMVNETLLMSYISSCNIASGGHFGTRKTIDKTIQLAIENDVLIGAHPSFPDKENFGRKVMNISKRELYKSIQNQLDLFLERLDQFNQKLHHIKPHGALYNLIAIDEVAAKNFVAAIQKYMQGVFLYVPYNSQIEGIAIQNDINIQYEAFGDRNYTEDLKLVSRKHKNAILTNPKEVYNHIYKMVVEGSVKTLQGNEKEIKADTFCIHGDNQKAQEILAFLSTEFSKKGFKIG
ncbi:LamB/YcsF family protein [Polaribacter sp. WD7]|uniref:5-oxoprolinase subunit PxpA n=1 Tax=Polaribacter sp. WD7 TaxID=2269061 RepID=UPI000DF338C1|nr:5-oxoprolinase subunit PxpA [Polaribacter sp. WD7]RCS26396.1 LamB/YcsF family protein [Polaribacter sp. WD7]